MEPFSTTAIISSVLFCTVMAYRSVYIKHSLSLQGGIAGWICGNCIIISTTYRGLLYFYFYYIGTICTKYKLHMKSQYDTTVQVHSTRNATQVLCVSIIVTVLSLYYGIMFRSSNNSIQSVLPMHYSIFPHSTAIMCAIIAHHATGLGDTMASELGILVGIPKTNNSISSSSSNSRISKTVLITNLWKTVPPGTNGGITLMGTIWSCIGGLIIGLLFILTDYCCSNNSSSSTSTDVITVQQYAIPVIVYSTIIGCVGSMIDSIIGATCQVTYYDTIQRKVYHTIPLSSTSATSSGNKSNIVLVAGRNLLTNEQVNLVSTAITCIIGGWVIGPLIIP